MLPDSVAEWRTLDVITWVGESMQLPQYAEAFAEGAVDGQMLMSLTDGDLKDELGVANAVHRQKLAGEIARLLKKEMARTRVGLRNSGKGGGRRAKGATAKRRRKKPMFDPLRCVIKPSAI